MSPFRSCFHKIAYSNDFYLMKNIKFCRLE